MRRVHHQAQLLNPRGRLEGRLRILEAEAQLPEGTLEIHRKVAEAAGAGEGSQEIVNVGEHKQGLIGRPKVEKARPPTWGRALNGQPRSPQKLHECCRHLAENVG